MASGIWGTAAQQDGSVFDMLPVRWLRVSMVVVGLLTAAAHLFALPGSTPQVTFWLETEVVGYVMVAIIFLLGLRSWYAYTIGYSLLNVGLFFVSALVILPGITHGLLLGHIDWAQYSYGRGFALGGWVYLIAVGGILLRYDRGSLLDELLQGRASSGRLRTAQYVRTQTYAAGGTRGQNSVAQGAAEGVPAPGGAATTVFLGVVMLAVGFVLLFSFVGAPAGIVLMGSGLLVTLWGIVAWAVEGIWLWHHRKS